MKKHTEIERQEHVENWKNGTLSKAAYAKSVGLLPTTFYTWVKDKAKGNEQNFVEIRQKRLSDSSQDIVIEKGSLIIRLPPSIGMKELQTVICSLEGTE